VTNKQWLCQRLRKDSEFIKSGSNRFKIQVRFQSKVVFGFVDFERIQFDKGYLLAGFDFVQIMFAQLSTILFGATNPGLKIYTYRQSGG
jgi:hypothetical protein